jgi:Domain of unknown function(DUF2779).
MERNKLISKSAYLIYKQCPKYLWYYINDGESIPEPDLTARFNFKAGHFTGSLAKKCFPEGIEIRREKDPENNHRKTLELMDLRKPLFGAGLLCKNACFFNMEPYGIYSRADILVPAENGLAGFGENSDEPGFLTNSICLTDTACSPDKPSGGIILKETVNPGQNCWDIIEVKISTGIKKVNLYDVAFQKYCCLLAGIDIRNCYVMHINKGYTLKGEIDPFAMFKITEVTEKIEKINLQIENDLKNMAEIISGDFPPLVNPGKFCGKHFTCPLKKNCWESISSKSILFLYSINHKMIKKLNESDIEAISDIPLNFSGINEKQKVQIEQTKNSAEYINKAAIANFLKQVSYPVFFLDFETFASPIPLIENTRPYQNIPFQFSLHVLRKPKMQLEYYHFLSDGRGDPRPALLTNLRNLFGFGQRVKSFNGTVIVYDESIERSILRDLVVFDTEHVNWIFKVASRIVDLYDPFKNFYYYSPSQRGSVSVKRVLPALTKKSYDEMAISNGHIAAISFLEGSQLWKESTSGIRQAAYEAKNEADKDFDQNSQEQACKNTGENEIIDEETETVRHNLLEYSKLDTEGLFHIMQELEKLII